MNKALKSEYIQIRVSKQEKQLIKSSAQLAGLDMSSWILDCALNNENKRFSTILNKFAKEEQTFVLAELHDFLCGLNRKNFEPAVYLKPTVSLSNFHINYIIAMIVFRANQLNSTPPKWISDFPILEKPHFGSNLKSLRLHLLINSPVAFKQRNIFIDSTIGDRV